MARRKSMRITKSDAYQPSHPMPPDILAKRRNCTDIICLFLFIIFIAVQVGLSVFAYWNGNPTQLVTPHDSNGQLCTGSTPFLFYFNLLECVSINALLTGCSTPQICVSQCPTPNLYYLIPEYRMILINNYCKQSDVLKYFNGTKPTSVTVQQYTELYVKNACPLYALDSSPLFHYCLPTIITEVASIVTNVTTTDSSNTTFHIYDNSTNQIITNTLVTSAVTYIKNLLNIKSVAQFILEDFVNAAYIIGLLLIISAIASFIYIIITRWIVGPMIWLSLVAIIGLFAFGTYFCIERYLSLKDTTQQAFQLTLNFNFYLQLSTTWLVFGIIAGVLLLIIILLVLVLIKRLRLAIGLIREASKAVTGIFFVLLWPIIPFLLQIGCFAYSISTGVYLASAGKALYRVTNTSSDCCGNATYKIGDSCTPATFSNQSENATCTFYRYGYGNPFNNAETTAVINFLNDYQWLPQFYNLFMMFWLQAFIVGLNQMVLAGSFAIWFWSKSKKCCIAITSVKDTLLYHLGSLAFGSLLIAIVQLIRAIIQFVENRVKAATGNNASTNCVITFVACCCKCCFWCLEKFLKFLSRNAYIMIAIYGKNFCSSAHDAVILLASNALRALVLDRVTDFILFLGKILITAGVGVLGFYFFTKKFYIAPNWVEYLAPDLHYYWVQLIAVILGTYYIAKTFFTVFEMAVDTLFLCAMKDLSINDGSEQKPYVMSKELRKLLHVKNVELSHKGSGKKSATVNPAFVDDTDHKPTAPPIPNGSNHFQYHDTFNNYS